MVGENRNSIYFRKMFFILKNLIFKIYLIFRISLHSKQCCRNCLNFNCLNFFLGSSTKSIASTFSFVGSVQTTQGKGRLVGMHVYEDTELTVTVFYFIFKWNV